METIFEFTHTIMFICIIIIIYLSVGDKRRSGRYNNELLDIESKINPDQSHIFISPGFEPVVYISQIVF